MANLIYIDTASIWVEGMHVAAAEHGKAPDVWTAVQHNICDSAWKIDYGNLFLYSVGDKSTVKKAALFGSRPFKHDSFWNIVPGCDFDLMVDDDSLGEPETGIEVEITTQIIADFYTRHREGDGFILVAGSRDYVPAVKHLVSRGVRVKVVFWKHASKELKNACSIFVPLDEHLDYLGHHS